MGEKNGNNLSGVKATALMGTIGPVTSSGSTEDLSEYTDADESISAPTECLAEFLSAVMMKDYPAALKHCKIILQYEPNNATAQEFYPLIISKLKQLSSVDNSDSSDCDDNYNPSVDHYNENEQLSDDNSDDVDSDTSESSETSSDKDLNDCHLSNSAASESLGTTHSCSSLEDEEAELLMRTTQRCLDLGNGNHSATFSYQSASDSESPTEPLTQQAVALLRSKALGTLANQLQGQYGE